MYAITFDFDIEALKKEYGANFRNAYEDAKEELALLGFERNPDNIYINDTSKNSLAAVYSAIQKLSDITWFRKSISFIRVFRVEELSDFTAIVKGD